MNRNIDIRHEVSRLANSKPVYAAAGAGVLASQALRRLPARVARWRSGKPVTSLPARATDYMHTARTRAVHGYDVLADRGKRVLANGHATTAAKQAANGRTTTAKTTKATTPKAK